MPWGPALSWSAMTLILPGAGAVCAVRPGARQQEQDRQDRPGQRPRTFHSASYFARSENDFWVPTPVVESPA